MTTQKMSVEKLIDPLPVAAFEADYRGKQHVYIPGPAEKFADVCSWDEINRLLDMSGLWSNELIALAHDGGVMAAEQYCTDAVDRDGYVVKRPDPAQVTKHIQDGATLVLNLTESLTPPIADVATCLQMLYGCPLKCNIYCSWQAEQGFTSHFDHTDVFVLHIDGRKSWNLYEGRFDQPMSGTEFAFARFSEDFHDNEKGRVLEEIEMTPGDLLYIPRGQYHDALAASEASLHLTFGVVHPTKIEMLMLLQNALREDPDFRTPLPHFDDESRHDEHVGFLVDRICEVLERPSTAAYLRDYLRGASFADCLPSYGLPDRDDLAVFRVRRDGADARDGLSGDEAAVADWVARREYFTADDLAESFGDHDTDRLSAIVQRLMAVGLIELRP